MCTEVTVELIAKKAYVSRSTVSRATAISASLGVFPACSQASTAAGIPVHARGDGHPPSPPPWRRPARPTGEDGWKTVEQFLTLPDPPMAIFVDRGEVPSRGYSPVKKHP